MFTLLLRLGPVLAGFGIYALFQWQWTHPLLFPWPVVAAALVYAIVAWRVAWTRSDRWSLLWKAVPGGLFVVAAGVCTVMLEQPLWRQGLSIFTAVGAYMSLELAFLMEYDAPHYPLNGLTHLHVGLVPLTNALLAWGFAGIRTFSKGYAPVWLLVLVFVMTNALGFAATSHPDASTAQRRAWILFGAWVGFGVALLILFLPLGMPEQAFMAALLSAAPLRLRRYGFPARPGAATAWIEGAAISLAFLLILLLSRWA